MIRNTWKIICNISILKATEMSIYSLFYIIAEHN